MYWLVSLPLIDGEEATWNLLERKTAYENEYSINYRFELPELRVGTLDALLTLSDDLVKVNQIMEGIVNKIRRQLFDLQSTASAGEKEDPLVDGLSPESYLENFKWDEAKYPSRRPLKDSVQSITETVQRLDDDLKLKTNEYNLLRSQYAALTRKQTGSLAVRDLSTLVNDSDMVDTENLITLLVVVPKGMRSDWLKSYESLTEFVVPRSGKQIAEDQEYVLFTVIVFKRISDSYKVTARQRGFQVRDYTHTENAAATTTQAAEDVKRELNDKKSFLEQFCLASYGEAFSAWVHICAIRLFAESILRYGLPPQFLGGVMKPNPKTQVKLRKLLAALFGSGHKHYDTLDKEGPGEELYPYVCFTLSIDN